jgi:hypothetical protein
MAIVILNEAPRSEESLSGGRREMLRCAQHDKTALSARAKYRIFSFIFCGLIAEC